MLQNHEPWRLFQIGERHFHYSPGSISVCIGEVGFWTSLNLDILELDEDSRPWSVIVLMWVLLRVILLQDDIFYLRNPHYHWPLIGSPKHDFPQICEPSKRDQNSEPSPLLYAADLHGDSTRSTIMPSFIYSHSTSLSLEWRIWSRWGIFISIEIMENHLDFQKVRVTKYCWCCRIPVPLGIYIYTYTHRKGRKQWDSCQLALDISHQQWYLVLADPLVLFNFYALKM